MMAPTRVRLFRPQPEVTGHRLSAWLCALLLCLLAGAPLTAAANLFTVAGDHFDLTYDDNQLGGLGAPTLSGSNFIFTPNVFRAQSINGGGLHTVTSLLGGIVLTPHAGYAINGLSLSSFGDYVAFGTGSLVNVSGTVVAYNTANPGGSTSSTILQLSALTPLNIADFAPHDWLAFAALNPGDSGVSPSLFGPAPIAFSLETVLAATTPQTTAGFNYAFIEEKTAVVGVVQTTVTAVPEPSTWVMLTGGLLCLFAVARKRRPA